MKSHALPSALNINKASLCPNVVAERALQNQSLHDWCYFAAICAMPKKVCAVHDRFGEGLTQKLINPSISKEAAPREVQTESRAVSEHCMPRNTHSPQM